MTDVRDPGVVTFTSGPFELELEAGAAGTPRRTLAGVAVPWGQVGRTSAGPTIFERGALPAGAGVPVLRDHDPTRVAGVLAETVDTDAGMTARARISATPLGDETLTLAADGALAGFSVGVRPTEYRYADDPDHGTVLVVSQATWRELTVTPAGHQAFTAATVHTVAASDPQTTNPQEDPQVTATATAVDPPAVLDTAPAQIVATATVVPNVTTRPRLPLTAGDVARVMIHAQRGDAQALELVAAMIAADGLTGALSSETTTNNLGIVPPSYSAAIIGGLPVATPFTSNLARRTGLPATGMSIIKPVWTSVPDGDWVDTENGPAPTNPVTIGTKPVPVLTYAHAVLASLNLVNRSDFGGFANAYFGQCGIDYLAKKETKVVAAALAAAAAVTGAGTATAVIGQCVAAVIAAQTTDGEFRGLMPEFAAVGAAIFSELAETQALDGFAFGAGSVQWGNLSGSLNGLVVALVPSLAARAVLVGSRAATVLHDGAEMQLRALVVNTLSVELGVIGNCAVDVEYPAALAKSTVPAPAAAAHAVKK